MCKMHTYAQAHAHPHTHLLTHTYTFTHSFILSHSLTHTHTRWHTHTHTLIHSHTHTHTHTHTLSLSVSPERTMMNTLPFHSSDTLYSAEELLGMMLEQAREYAQDFAGTTFFVCFVSLFMLRPSDLHPLYLLGCLLDRCKQAQTSCLCHRALTCSRLWVWSHQVPAWPRCSFNRGSIGGTNSLKICVWCLCKYVSFYVCVGTGSTDWLEKRFDRWEEFRNGSLLMAEFDCPEVTLCNWQDVQIQLLTPIPSSEGGGGRGCGGGGANVWMNAWLTWTGTRVWWQLQCKRHFLASAVSQ